LNESVYICERCVLETLGEYLKSKREARDITLEEIAKATRIRKAILEAIESNKHDILPPRVFTQGFLRSYASYLGLDESDVVKRYQETLEEVEAKNDEEEIASQKPPKKVLTPARIIVLSIIFIVALAFWFFKSPLEKEKISPLKDIQEKATTKLVEPSPVTESDTLEEESGEDMIGLKEESGLPAEDEDSETKPEGTETEPMVLRIIATEGTWVKFQLDQDEPFEILLRAGESFRAEANEKFNLRIGNAGGVKLFFNEKPLGNPGKPGEVIDLTLPE